MTTIVALATPPGRGGVAVIRLSGTDLAAMAEALTGVSPKPRFAHFAAFKDSQGETLDQGLLLWFKAPHSYTGEDVLELHTHGGEIAPERVLKACLALGALPAPPGEFTRRAFLNGKLNLLQAEAVADLISANSEAAARGAIRSLVGDFSDQVRALQGSLTRLRVELESGFDFPEEGIDQFSVRELRGRLLALHAEVAHWIKDAQGWARHRAGIVVAIIGAPNVGKSSLLNALAGEPLAIVSDEPGTTRDAIRVVINIEGWRVEIADTAGIRSTDQAIERMGIERSWAAASEADLILWLRAPDVEDAAIELPANTECVEVWNKSDQYPSPGLSLSAKTGAGIDALKGAIRARLMMRLGGEPGFLPRARHLAALGQVAEHLERACFAGTEEELVAEELARAQKALDALSGEVSADDLLGEIFSTFCIGK